MEIKGIVIERQETRLLQYDDDTTAVLSDIESAYKLFQLLDKFKKISGLKVNTSKTEGLWIGSLKGSETKPLGTKWPRDPIKPSLSSSHTIKNCSIRRTSRKNLTR